ncbi:MAG TPA: carbohydrate kinase family protein [Candidatus Paceibacterota bacterium]|jgi:sugar/nucleoside kinase (ribokinase family)|nr:carbohydrate kinase family protein [Candidatus Paceibacterota bacterium]
MDQLDFLAIGDIVCEPFIRLKEAEVHCDKGAAKCEICMSWGDKIPYEFFVFVPAVGNASNAAVSASRLGLKTALRAYVGPDHYGQECLDRLTEEKVDTSYMVTEPGKNTNYHYVLWYESERTILVKHEEYSYTVPELTNLPKWIYLSSLADHTLPYHLELIRMLEAHPEIKLAFNPGTFQMSLGANALAGLYARTDFFSCNVEEAGRILGTDRLDDIRGLLVSIAKLGPKIVVITDGTKGAYAFDGSRMMYVPMYPDSRGPYERTGAGDAFTSTVASALALGEPLEKALLWGPINSMSVVQEVGAQKGLLTREQLLEYLSKAPSSYAVRDL